MSLDLPEDNEINWGDKFRTAFQTLFNLVNSKADSAHTHPEYPTSSHEHEDYVSTETLETEVNNLTETLETEVNNLQTQIDDVDSRLNTTKTALQDYMSGHVHTLSEISDLANLLQDFSLFTAEYVQPGGTSFASQHVTFKCRLANQPSPPLITWCIGFYWGELPQPYSPACYETVCVQGNFLSLPKPEANSPVWDGQGHCQLHVSMQAINPFNGTQTPLYCPSPYQIQKQNFITVADLVNDIAGNGAIIQSIADNVAQKVVLEAIWTKTQE